MNAELTNRMRNLNEYDQKQLCVVLNWQILHKDIRELLDELSPMALEWLVEYETHLLETTGYKEV